MPWIIVGALSSAPGQKKQVLAEDIVGHGFEGRPSKPVQPGCLPETDRILIRFHPSSDQSRVMSILKGISPGKSLRIPPLDLFVLQVPEGLTAAEMAATLRLNPEVEFCEPDYRTFVCEHPNDTFYALQYGLRNTGQKVGIHQNVSGTPGADIKAEEAWNETKGKETVVVAVLDTGLDFDHPDLQGNIASSGRDFVNGGSLPFDDHGHGTMISSIIAADTDNGLGIAGAGWNCKILPVKSIAADGMGYTSWMIDAVIWAADLGVDVINLSIGADGPSQSLREALAYASARDVVIVSSAGNHHGAVAYPAAYEEYCLAVGATNYFDAAASFSNHGPEIDVAAPGVGIFVCVPTWQKSTGTQPYGFVSGTSAATAYVSALAALIRSLKPWLSAAEVRNLICFTADDVNQDIFPGRDDHIGYGRVNMKKALAPNIIY